MKSLSDFIFAHLGEKHNTSIEIIQTCDTTPTSKSSLTNLTEKLSKLLLNSPNGPGNIETNEGFIRILKQIARYQFDFPGVELLNNSKIVGRYPNLKIFSEGAQLGMLTGIRGLIPLLVKNSASEKG